MGLRPATRRLGFGRIEGGRLVHLERVLDGLAIQVEVVLGRATGGREAWRRGGQVEVAEDGAHRLRSGDEGKDAHLGAAVGAEEREDLEDAGEEASPAGARGGWRGETRRV